MNECQCQFAGYCPSLKRNMSVHWHQLCKTRSDYRAVFESMVEEKHIATPSPTPYEMAESFISSTATFLHNGAQVTPKELHDQRLAICRTCEEMKPGKVLGVALPRLDSCNVCGCFVTLKAAYPHEKCPVGLWDSVSTGKGCGGCGG